MKIGLYQSVSPKGDIDVGLSAICGPDGYALATKEKTPGLLVAEVPKKIGENGISWSTQLQELKQIPQKCR